MSHTKPNTLSQTQTSSHTIIRAYVALHKWGNVNDFSYLLLHAPMQGCTLPAWQARLMWRAEQLAELAACADSATLSLTPAPGTRPSTSPLGPAQAQIPGGLDIAALSGVPLPVLSLDLFVAPLSVLAMLSRAHAQEHSVHVASVGCRAVPTGPVGGWAETGGPPFGGMSAGTLNNWPPSARQGLVFGGLSMGNGVLSLSTALGPPQQKGAAGTALAAALAGQPPEVGEQGGLRNEGGCGSLLLLPTFVDPRARSVHGASRGGSRGTPTAGSRGAGSLRGGSAGSTAVGLMGGTALGGGTGLAGTWVVGGGGGRGSIQADGPGAVYSLALPLCTASGLPEEGLGAHAPPMQQARLQMEVRQPRWDADEEAAGHGEVGAALQGLVAVPASLPDRALYLTVL